MIKSIQFWNVVAGVAHFVNFLTVLVLTKAHERGLTYQLKLDYLQISAGAPPLLYHPEAINKSVCNIAAVERLRVSNLNLFVNTFPRDAHTALRLEDLIMAFFALSCGFQLFAGLFHYRHLKSSEFKVNWYRYIEYAFSAPLMLVALELIMGVKDVFVISFTFVTCSFCMLLGGVAEQVWLIHVETNHRSLEKSAWCIHFIAWGCLIIPFAVIGVHLSQWYLGAGGCANNPVAQPPWFLPFLVFAQGLLFLSFGVVQSCRMVNWVTHFQQELYYLFLSLVSKSVLAWTVAANLIIVQN